MVPTTEEINRHCNRWVIRHDPYREVLQELVLISIDKRGGTRTYEWQDVPRVESEKQ